MNLKTDGKIFHDNLSEEIPGVYPWQYKEYDIRSLVLLPIEPDINLYWNEGSLFRKGFSVNNETKEIFIPNFFLKINGKHKDTKEYIEFVRLLSNSKNTLVLNKQPNFTYPYYYISDHIDTKTTAKEFIGKLKYKGNLESIVEQYVDDLIKKENEKFKSTFCNIVKDKQNQIRKIMISTIIKNINNWTVESLDSFIMASLFIPEDVIPLINNFDYNYDIPKIVFENFRFDQRTAFLVYLLNEIAFDIVVLDTSGQTTIEKYIEIPSLSLGYFEKKFDIYARSLTIDKRIEKYVNNMEKEERSSLFHYLLIAISSIIVVGGLFILNGVTNTIIEILLFAGIWAISYYFYENNFFDDDEPHVNTAVIFCGLVAILLLIRGFIGLVDSMPEGSVDTITYTGSLNKADHTLDTKNDYIIYSKKDAVLQKGSNHLYLYLENNEINEDSIYFIIIHNNKEIYQSTPIKPYEYINEIDLDYFLNDDKDSKLTIQYYTYDENSRYSYTNELLGSEEIILHMALNETNLKELLDEYNLK